MVGDPKDREPSQEGVTEVVSFCTGRAWRVALAARDPAACRAVEELLEDSATWQACEQGWRLVGSREYATDADPQIDVTVAVEYDPSVVATLDGREMRVRPARGSPPRPLRVATAVETVEAGLRWVLGVGHLGCLHPDEFAFWARRTEARVYVAVRVDEWLAEGACVSLDTLAGRSGIFVAYIGEGVRFGELGAIVDALEARHPDAALGAGIFVTPASGTRALIVVADLDDCEGMPEGHADDRL